MQFFRKQHIRTCNCYLSGCIAKLIDAQAMPLQHHGVVLEEPHPPPVMLRLLPSPPEMSRILPPPPAAAAQALLQLREKTARAEKCEIYYRLVIFAWVRDRTGVH